MAKRLGEILMSIADYAVPAAAVVASTYGPSYAAAGKLGLDAYQTTRDNQRQRKIGKRLAEISPAMRETELDAMQKRWEQYAPPVDETFGMGEDFTGPPTKEMGAGLDTDRIRLKQFREAMPTGAIDIFYKNLGAVAEDNPELAQQMINDRASLISNMDAADLQFSAEKAKTIIESGLREKADDKQRAWQGLENEADRELRKRGIRVDELLAEANIDQGQQRLDQGAAGLDIERQKLAQDQGQFEQRLATQVEEGALDRESAQKIASIRGDYRSIQNRGDANAITKYVESTLKLGRELEPKDLQDPKIQGEIMASGMDERTLLKYFEAIEFLRESSEGTVVRNPDGSFSVVRSNKGQGE